MKTIRFGSLGIVAATMAVAPRDSFARPMTPFSASAEARIMAMAQGDSPASPTFDVRKYGAVGNGSTPDTVVLQKAIDAAAPRDKNIRLKRCADLLRSAIDTNQIERACHNLTNQPGTVLLRLRESSQDAMSLLDRVAGHLTDPKLKTFTADLGECAQVSGPGNKNCFFVFYHKGPVMLFDSTMDVGDRGRKVEAYFYASGKLRFIEINKEHSRERIDFNEDGTFYGYSSSAAGKLVSFYSNGSAVPPEGVNGPIGQLVARLAASQGLWQNGLAPAISLPAAASTAEVVAKALEGHTASYKILEVRDVHIHGSLWGLYRAVLVQTNAGEKIVLLRYQGQSAGWWSRIYDAHAAE